MVRRGRPEVRVGRTRVRPTVFGIAVTVVLVGLLVTRPAVADPSVAGLVLAGLGGALVFGTAWPVIAVRTLGVRVVEAPTDLVVGQLATVEVELTGRASGLSVGAAGSATAVVDVISPGRVKLPLSVSARGAFSRVAIEVSSDAPFGIAWAVRVRDVELPRRMLVGPRVLERMAPIGELPGQMQEPLPQGAGPSGETVRTVRPYVPGDPAHLVHWPSTARTGTLVVRELEPPAATGLAVVVDLRHHAESDERVKDTVAGIAAGVARDALRRGARVMLCTAERDGPVAAETPDEISLQRRLALAVPDVPAPPPPGWPVVVIDTSVAPEPTAMVPS